MLSLSQTGSYNNRRGIKFINADFLKLLAMFFMTLDHLWATIIPGNQWMTYVGRLAFPIFAFQISEGFIHTSNFKKYAQRLFIFALISEIPFNLFYSSSIFYPFHQNVLFTLLLGLLTVKALDRFSKEISLKNGVFALLALVFFPLIGTFGFTDYGAMGVLTVVAFYLFRDFPFAWVLQLISMILLNIVFFTGMYIPLEILGRSFDFEVQGFAVLALIPIWLYNGRKGSSSPIFKYSMYIFYPAHVLILYFITRLM